MKKKNLYIVCLSFTLFGIIGLLLSSILVENTGKYWWTFFVSLLLLIGILLLTCIVYFKNVEFICNRCNKQFKPKIKDSLMATHTLTKRFLKCPHCNEKSWCKETWNIKK